MAEEFVRESIASESANPESSLPEREPVRMILVGCREGVIEQMHILYQKGYAHVDESSPLQPTGKPGEVIAILIRYFKRFVTNTRKSGR
ncbi:MAG TPA: peptide ABC transporter substrate-binding protein [Cyanobacteria bacterium UBA11369]|nr:peptide ABC transporter substrate-binding protein [Cyanobacteria bacterium UBA11371]HBE33932.1 peptide ABC transporter substrate-binding protein [Cyanobacteria bacterium UBA11368]HBE53241.1 peptide ABC transporter substrate-binding protein [Cyanobacteria bacterium UBA11369]